jgi:hypothetical protein
MSKATAKCGSDSGHCFGKSNLEITVFLVELDYVNGKGWISPFSGEFMTL